MLVIAQVKFDLRDSYNDGDAPQIPFEELDLREQYLQLSNDSLLWGPYRSALYFGLRPRIPRSLLSGLMWYEVNEYSGIGNVRHFYEQSENMKRANWIKYDPRYGGRQVIDDEDVHAKIIIDFVKSTDGRSWGVKVKAQPYKDFPNTKIAFVWYSGLEGQNEEGERNGYISLDNEREIFGYDGTVKLTGLSEDLGLFEIEINDPAKNKHPNSKSLIDPELDPSKAHHYSLNIPDDYVWRARDVFMTMLQESVKDLVAKYEALDQIPPEQAFILRDLQKFEGNLHFIQKIYEGPAEFDIIYTSAVTPATEKITFDNIEDRIARAQEKFDDKFKKNFELSAPFSKKNKYTKFAKEALSGLLGGLSYSYGDHLVDRNTVLEEDSFESYELEGQSEGPFELFTLVPSRPFFPRGFLWDEGFHLLPLLKYDSDLVFEIMKSWFNLIDDDGWVAREQILGPEARSRVPEKFQVQSPQIVNPPTLMLAFTFLLENTKKSIDSPEQYDDVLDKNNLGLVIISNPSLLFDYAKSVYPKLKAHYEMFRRTQWGHIEEFNRGDNKEGYRWRGRTTSHCLASGIDDYPRALPADVAELNVDLLSWIGVMARSMKQLAELCEYKEDWKQFSAQEEAIIKNLNALHWSEEEKTYCDVSVNDDDENIFVCHKGYISLFPFITKLMSHEDTDKLSALVDLIIDPEELWSKFGVRSLSKSDPKYRTEENYWRSPIWININYLILESFQHYHALTTNEALKIKIGEAYNKLRLNLVHNVFKQHELTGYIWEQYDDITGAAKGAKNFLGWSSAVVLMMDMPEKL